jgi:molybdopterin-binding protein
MKLSAVNQIKGKVMEIRKGAVTTIIYVQIAGDQMIEVSATVASVEALGLFEGKNVTLVVNSTDIIIACE